MRASTDSGSISSVSGSTSAKTGVAALEDDGVGRGGEGDGRDDHFVARADARARTCAACSAAVPLLTATACSRARDRGQRPLELGHLRPGRQPVGAQRLDHARRRRRRRSSAARRAAASSDWLAAAPASATATSRLSPPAPAARRSSASVSLVSLVNSKPSGSGLPPFQSPLPHHGCSGRITYMSSSIDGVPGLVARDQDLVQLLARADADDLDLAVGRDRLGQVA